ncbi:MAG TPA: NAD(P)H-dependent glycerol-3-phosphate dehydrogenase [Candidatus Acidoferrum sp.]|nr:NAD(P)H-dependent glycerol-3-phosphate dehydrogenase [Candidatus Acidoferrum sp.]
MTLALIGGGSWGTALATHCGRRGLAVRLWVREPEIVESIARTRRNPWYLADVELPASVRATGDLGEALDGATMIVVAVPSEFVDSVLKSMGRLRTDVPIVSATKGFDPTRHVRMTELLADRGPHTPVAALSGPTFAREVALGLPTACVVASRDETLARRLQGEIGTREFRLYTNTDVIGVEVGGALKNVIAIATGLSDGLELGQNARAALITRGLAEITRLGVALGAAPATLAGLAGLGDLVLTCTGALSRNRSLGMALARGQTQAAVEGETRMIAEGARTVRSALALAERHGVTLPICAEVGEVLFAGKPPADALATLLGRAMRPEDVPLERK